MRNIEYLRDIRLMRRRSARIPERFYRIDIGTDDDWHYKTNPPDTTGQVRIVEGVGPFGDNAVEFFFSDRNYTHVCTRAYNFGAAPSPPRGFIIYARIVDQEAYDHIVDVTLLITQDDPYTPNPVKYLKTGKIGLCQGYDDCLLVPGEWRPYTIGKRYWPDNIEVGGWSWSSNPRGYGVEMFSGNYPGTYRLQLASPIYVSNTPIRGACVLLERGGELEFEGALYCLRHQQAVAIAMDPQDVGKPGYLSMEKLRTLHRLGAEIVPYSKRSPVDMSTSARMADWVRVKSWVINSGFTEAADILLLPVTLRPVQGVPIPFPVLTDAVLADAEALFSVVLYPGGGASCHSPDPPMGLAPTYVIGTHTTEEVKSYFNYAIDQSLTPVIQFRGLTDGPSTDEAYNLLDFKFVLNGISACYSARLSTILTQ